MMYDLLSPLHLLEADAYGVEVGTLVGLLSPAVAHHPEHALLCRVRLQARHVRPQRRLALARATLHQLYYLCKTDK